MKQLPYSFAILALAISIAILVAFAGKNASKKFKTDCTIGSVEKLDSLQVLHVYRCANRLIEQGDSISGQVLKGALMTKR